MEKKVHKQYLAQVKLAFDAKSIPEHWWNAVYYASSGYKRYAKNLDEAQSAIEFMRNRFPNDPDQQVVESRIRVREVTDWEFVESSKVLSVSEEG